MTIEEHVQQGDYRGALELLAPQLAEPAPDPGLVLMAFNLEVRLQRFDAAARSIRRLLGLAPAAAASITMFERNARAEAMATARLTDPQLAGRRSGIGAPPAHALAYVKAAVHHAEHDHAGAAAALAEARQVTPATPGLLTWRNGRTARFADLTDSDDLTGPILPCYDGETLLDLPYLQLRSVTFLDARTSFDVMWIPAGIVPVTGSPMIVKVPAYHPGTGVATTPEVRIGRLTMWDHSRGYAQAIGQRDLKLITPDGSAAMVGIQQVRSIELDAAAPAPTTATGKPKGFWKKLLG